MDWSTLFADIWDVVAIAIYNAWVLIVPIILGQVALYLPPILRGIWENKLRDDLTVAANNAAQAALDGDWQHFDFDKGDREALIAYIVECMREGAGEAIGRFKPSLPKLKQYAQKAIANERKNIALTRL
ncbi:hypothetical protein LX81_00294 [Palleronia aestuarii]|uniref:Uncharacterized protein n=1 Tax=Palleronia aestuarii TaxID=568105 RepID=A0A2W7NHC6_9RHOB|nr:hypothetical protein [Palleronia aestuarii]PZX19831.1 hypothetical protein LX81_00294 [Palleronia aestuarii]